MQVRSLPVKPLPHPTLFQGPRAKLEKVHHDAVNAAIRLSARGKRRMASQHLDIALQCEEALGIPHRLSRHEWERTLDEYAAVAVTPTPGAA